MKYYIWALGCAMNKSDAERIASVFEGAGYSEANKETEADVVVTVACSVRQHAIDRIYGKVEKWSDMRSKKPLTLILSGCVLAVDKKKMGKFFDLIFEINDISKLTNFLKAKTSEETGFFSIHPKYESSFRALVPISTGCNNFCTYCAVPYTRGREISRSKREIIEEVKDLVKKGYKEITLLGQNVNSYGNDLKKRNYFVELIKEVDKIPGDYRAYFYSNHPKDMSDELIRTLPNLNHFPKYIHLPLQSGSDKILKTMNRHYTQKDYLNLVDKIRKSISAVTITTDIIVGFPGETSEDFDETKKVLSEAKFSMPFIAKYSPRPGTKAERLDDNVPKKEKERRWRELTDLQTKILESENKKLVGKEMRILIDAKKGDKYFGRTDNYKVVEIPKKQKACPEENRRDLLGQFVDVKIVDSSAWMLEGFIN